MKKYILADIRRCLRRVPRDIIMLVLFVLMLVFLWQSEGHVMTSSETLSTVQLYNHYLQKTAIPIIFGILEMIFLLMEDFKAKTIVGAIGYGLGREKIVFCKWIALAVLSLLNIIFLSIPLLILSLLGQIPLAGYWEVILCGYCMAWIKILLYGGTALALAYASKSSLLSMLGYLLFASRVLEIYLGVVCNTKWLSLLHLDRILPTMEIHTFCSQLLLGHFNVSAFFIIWLYLAAAFAAGIFVFRKRELDF